MSWLKAENASLAPQRVVHRMPITIAGWTEIQVEGYRGVVHVADSRIRPGVEIDVWVERELDTQGELEAVVFSVHGTGHMFRNTGNHVGTVFTHAGELVWHVYATPLGVVRG